MIKNKKLLFCIFIGLILLIFWIQKTDSDYIIERDIGIHNRVFKEYVVFYPQHQDDEVLWGGSALKRAVNTLGPEHVFVVLGSDGSGVNVFKDKFYKNKSRKEKAELRNKEFYAALYDLGIKEENILILADMDNKSGDHFDLMKEVALGFEKKYKSVTHVAHTYKYDDHPMHRKNGSIIIDLYNLGKIKDAMFYLKPQYIKKVPSDKRVIYKATNNEDYEAIVNACNEYRVINKDEDRHGIGYISAHSHFDQLLSDPELTSVFHLPY